MERLSWAPEHIDIDRPSAARAYDYMLGGSHNFAVDRQLCAQMMLLVPEITAQAHGGRAFMRRAVGFCVAAGIRQFLDLGSGIPTRGNVHDVVQRLEPEGRVMYVDIDPTAVVHSRDILAGNDRVRVIQADVRQPGYILAHPDVRSVLDLTQPIAVLMVNVLHLVPEDPTGIVAAFRDAVVPGSYLVMCHMTVDSEQEKVAEALKLTQRHGLVVKPRSPAELHRLFTGFELVEPGLVWTHEWRPDPPDDLTSDPEPTVLIGGVGRKT